MHAADTPYVSFLFLKGSTHIVQVCSHFKNTMNWYFSEGPKEKLMGEFHCNVSKVNEFNPISMACSRLVW